MFRRIRLNAGLLAEVPVPRGLTGAVANPITVADAAGQITFANNVVAVAD